MLLKSLYESTLRELTKKLNAIHEVRFSLRYWRIIVGHLLGYFIQILFNRWFSINHILAFYNINNEDECDFD
jgi:putative transferase (TIGR04331 family)